MSITVTVNGKIIQTDGAARILIENSNIYVNGKDVTPSTDKTDVVTVSSTFRGVTDSPCSKGWKRKYALLSPVLVASPEGAVLEKQFCYYEELRIGEWNSYHRFRRLPGSLKAYHEHEVDW